jgi:hypothetical protein
MPCLAKITGIWPSQLTTQKHWESELASIVPWTFTAFQSNLGSSIGAPLGISSLKVELPSSHQTWNGNLAEGKLDADVVEEPGTESIQSTMNI